MAAFSYSEWLSHLITILQVSDPDGQAALNSLVPYFIERAEQLIYSDPDMDFLLTRATDISQHTTNGSRAVPIPAQMVTVEGVNMVIPASTPPSSLNAQRIPLQRTTRQFIDFTWPTESYTQTPNALQGGYFAIFDFEQANGAPGEDEPSALPSSFLISPTPDNTYIIEVTGTFRPIALSAQNTSTPLTSFFYPLFLAATLVVAFGYQRDFGAASDDPKTAMSWEVEYQMQKQIAVAESKRQKAQMGGYSATAVPMPMPTAGPMAAALRGPHGPMGP